MTLRPQANEAFDKALAHADAGQVASYRSKADDATAPYFCVSPKARTELRVRAGHELKVVVPQDDLDSQRFCIAE